MYRALALSLLILLGSCQSSSFHPTVFTQNVMTINYRILVGERLTTTQKAQIQNIIDATFHEIDHLYNKWNPSSELSQLNALPADTPYLLSKELFRFFEHLDMLIQLSEGYFDPTVEPLQQLWKKYLVQQRIPSLEEIEALKPCIGWHHIHFKDGIFYKDHGQTQLDLGGVAKGFCVDLLIERLQRANFQHLYVEWGGDMRTLGRHPAKRPWCVYISHLDNPDPTQAIAQLELTNRALATSGDYFQFWKVQLEAEEKTYCHIFNPFTLTPLEVKSGSIASASLLAKDCLTADALAKVLMLFDNVEEAQAWIEKLQEQLPELACWLVVRP